MKASGPAVDKYLSSKTEVSPLTLVFGANESQTRRLVQKKSGLILNDKASEEMRVHSFEGKELIKDRSILFDAVKSQSFFPGPVGILIYACVDGLHDTLTEVLNDWVAGDAFIFAQAGNLTKTSKLRKSFEASQKAMVIGIYNDPLNAVKMNQMFERHGLRLDTNAKDMLIDFGKDFEEIAFDRFLEGISIFQGDQKENLTLQQVEKIIPAGYASAVDDLISFVLNNDPKNLVQSLRRAPAQGVSHHQIVSMATWRVHALTKVKGAADPSRAMMQMRPPLFGQRRTQFETTLRKWSLPKLEAALQLLSETELKLRQGAQFTPEAALVERNLLKICFLNR